MKNLFEITLENAFAIAISGLLIYASVIFFTRISGKRSISKISSFDFAITIALGSIIATSLLSKSVSLLEGIFGLLCLYTYQAVAAYFRRYKAFHNLIDNTPLLLMKGSNILHKNLKKAQVTETDLRAKLREANVLNLSQVRAVVFETTGDVVVLHTNQEDVTVESWLLEDVAEN